jgi:sterol desaturase/sphingolipid hydroxylase (fatty acid hydroxylase superfamily)
MTSNLITTEPQGMLLNEIFLLLAIAAFVVLLILEGIKPYRQTDKQTKRNSLVTNSTTFIVNNLILTALRASSLFFVAQQFSQFGLLGGVDNGPIKWLLAFLLFDLGIYLWHLASHRNEFLWRFHKIHHSDKTVNVTTGFRFHIFDLFLETIVKCIFVVIVGVDAYLVLTIEVIELTFIFYHHSNLSFKQDEQISQWLITPYLHRTHHSSKRAEHDSNYGIVLSIWDRLFKTRLEREPKQLGLDVIEAENFVQLFFLAFVTEDQIKKLLRILPKGR